MTDDLFQFVGEVLLSGAVVAGAVVLAVVLLLVLLSLFFRLLSREG